MTVVARRSAGGVDLELELERQDLLPGRLAAGRLQVSTSGGREIRGAYATLHGTEHWQYERTERDANGNSRTEIVTAREDLPRIPVRLLAATALEPGEIRDLPFELPVPSLGPPSVDATVAGVEWEVEAKLDVPGFDPAVVLPVTIHQPTAVLRAGTVDVGQFALWPLADAEASEARATIFLDPVPLCLGASFSGRLTLDSHEPMELQEVRLELRVHVEATVSSGREEEITVWTGRLAGPGALGSEPRTLEFSGTVPPMALPTARLPHGRTAATFRVVLARAWRRDPNLVRDVALCTTTEL